jgi:hypothetical protein
MAVSDGPRTEGSGSAEAMRHFARADPVNDTLPAFQQLIAGADGLLWVVDYVSPIDRGWSATAFDQDGTIVGRLMSRVPGRPVAFTARGVLVREEDADGVVRFGVCGVEGWAAVEREAAANGCREGFESIDGTVGMEQSLALVS